MRLHGDRAPFTRLYGKDRRPALFTGGDNEVWSFGEEAYQILTKYMELRELMRPYTRDLMKQAHEKGTPVIRTMFYEFPQDKECWELKDQYMFGSEMLVAPVVYADSYEREVYLPKGASWTSIHDGKIYEGGQSIRVAAPLDIIPVFLKNDSCRELIGKVFKK